MLSLQRWRRTDGTSPVLPNVALRLASVLPWSISGEYQTGLYKLHLVLIIETSALITAVVHNERFVSPDAEDLKARLLPQKQEGE